MCWDNIYNGDLRLETGGWGRIKYYKIQNELVISR
jgi:hypothetical protein